MSQYYLVSSLPELELGAKPPMTPEEFLFRLHGVLTEEELASVQAVLEGNSDGVPAGFAKEWSSFEAQLRNACVRYRAQKAGGMDAANYLHEFEGYRVSLEKSASDALSASDPLEREKRLDQTRFDKLNEMASADAFGFTAVLAFASKLKLVMRWAGMEAEVGREKVETFIDESTQPTAKEN